MEMNGLQRSTTSFRRQGSSGLVWDNKFLSGDLNRMKLNNQENRGSDDDHGMITKRSRSGGGGHGHMSRAMKTTTAAASRSFDPPSPKVSGCGFCGVVFGKPDAAPKKRR